MILSNPQMMSTIEVGAGRLQTVVIENRRFFRHFVEDIYHQINNEPGQTVLSDKGKALNFSRSVEMTDSFISFTINRKTLQSKIMAVMEKRAAEAEMFSRTAELLSVIEQYVYDLAADVDANIECSKVNIAALLKMVGVSIRDDYEDPLERIIDYMELTRDFDRDKLFMFINMRDYFSCEELELFTETALSHDLSILLIDSHAEEYLKGENRLTIDNDLCEF